jgi:hypothetical protein
MRLVTDVELFVNVNAIQLKVRYAELCDEAKEQFDKWEATGCISHSNAVFSAVVETPARDTELMVKSLSEEHFGKIVQSLATKPYDEYSTEDRAILLSIASRMAKAVKEAELSQNT